MRQIDGLLGHFARGDLDLFERKVKQQGLGRGETGRGQQTAQKEKRGAMFFHDEKVGRLNVRVKLATMCRIRA